MGRDKPKKYNKMGYFEKEQWKRDEAKKRGIASETYTDFRGNTQTRVNEKALNSAIRNDFDYRTSAQHMDGVKGNASAKDFVKYQRGAQKLHKKAGNGGQFSSNEDITTVTNNLVKDYRKSIQDQIDANKDQASSKNTDNKNTLDDFDGPFEFEYSDKVQGAKDRIDEYELDVRSGKSIFNQDNNTPVAGDDQAAAADAFVDIYKADLLDAANLQENKAQNLNNSMDAVASYRSKFMK